MNTHTPGPWVCEDNDGFSLWTIWSKMAPSGSGIAGQKIANVCGDSGEADANARLISAAPDLLDACEAMLREFGRGAFGDAILSDSEESAIARSSTAIAKAKGQMT